MKEAIGMSEVEGADVGRRDREDSCLERLRGRRSCGQIHGRGVLLAQYGDEVLRTVQETKIVEARLVSR